ncbi:PREDICTED: hemicentin-2-like [Priapulus caudatus]|uniref:Hemicentin-2-like n=1 Tax=Priapulus caudatus TaxID=37621 RepID=A0ABM1EXL3_PRICU|nr:PREDICTED: hemicentin-2-like [Priapulus caudatus]
MPKPSESCPAVTCCTLPRVQTTHEARYMCRVKNDAGVSEKEFNLQVLVPPSISDKVKDVYQVVTNSTVSIGCPATGKPEPTITWLRNGQPLIADVDDVEFLADGRQLRVSAVQAFQTGTYSCRAQNSAGEAEKDFRLQVLVPPKISTDLTTDFEVFVNQPISIQCPVKGTPMPDVIWMFNGHALSAEGLEQKDIRITRGGQQMDLTHTLTEHAGTYTCRAENDAGLDQRDFRVQVFGTYPLIKF